MIYSYNWLQEYFDHKLPSAKKIADLITLHIAEVESLKKIDEGLENIYLGKVLSIKKHSQADRLWLVEVTLGNKKFNIVCGGINLKEGELVAVAVPGAKVKWHNQEALVEIKESKIRGEKSEGMICAPNEIGLENLFPEYQEKEILNLNSVIPESNIGLPIAKVLGLNDSLIEVENKNITNRPDLWSYLGLAREIGTILNLPITKEKEIKRHQLKELNKDIKLIQQFKANIVDKNGCLFYSLFYLDNFKIGLSPFWLRKKIFLTGHRSINNLVDFTNYVLFEFGQPMHAFDAEKINGSTILVRRAKDNEKLEALNGEKYSLSKNDLVVADQEKPLAIAGIIGGINSSVSHGTKNIVLEVATFNPIIIRQTSQKLQLSTESSKRFERNINPLWTSQIAACLHNLLKKAFSKCDCFSIFNHGWQTAEKEINFNFSRLFKIIGFEVKNTQKILKRLGFVIKGNKITVPLWRSDISIEEDIIEEIIRINGLDKLNPTLPHIILRNNNYENDGCAVNPLFVGGLKKFFTLSLSLDEVLNYSFISEEQIKAFDLSVKDLIKIKNPLSKNQIALRNSLIPGLFSNLQKNQYYFNRINIFETGSVYFTQRGSSLAKPNSGKFLPRQEIMLAGTLMDKNSKLRDLFFTFKGKIETFLDYYNINEVFKNSRHHFFDKCLSIGNIGFIGIIKPKICYQSGLNFPVVAFELNVDQIVKNINKNIKYYPLRKFNLITRDLKIKFSQNDPYGDLINKIVSSNKTILKTRLIKVLDNYLIVRLFFGRNSRNITNEEVNKIIIKMNSQFDFVERC